MIRNGDWGSAAFDSLIESRPRRALVPGRQHSIRLTEGTLRFSSDPINHLVTTVTTAYRADLGARSLLWGWEFDGPLFAERVVSSPASCQVSHITVLVSNEPSGVSLWARRQLKRCASRFKNSSSLGNQGCTVGRIPRDGLKSVQVVIGEGASGMGGAGIGHPFQ